MNAEKEFRLHVPGGVRKFNVGQSGFYRVKYSESGWVRLCEQLTTFSPLDRLGVQADCIALARAGILTTGTALSVIRAYQSETDYTVWADLSSNLADIATMLYGTDCTEKFKSFQRELFLPIARKVSILVYLRLMTLLNICVCASLVGSLRKILIQMLSFVQLLLGVWDCMVTSKLLKKLSIDSTSL